MSVLSPEPESHSVREKSPAPFFGRLNINHYICNMEHTKENLKGLSLVEIKQICKRYGLRRTGSKTVLINSIVKYTTEPEVTVSLPTEYKPSPGKKVVGIIMGDTEKSVQLGKLKEKNKAKLLYYSMGVHYYEIDKEFKFM